MEKKLFFALTLTLAYQWGETASKGLDGSQPELDTNLEYAIDDRYFDDFSKLLDDNREENSNENNSYDNIKAKVNSSGYKRKKSNNDNHVSEHSVGNFKKLFNSDSLHDKEDCIDDDAHENTEGNASKDVKVTGDEVRKYRKGTKTRGFHHVQHKDEYKKDKEIYEDDETSGVIKKKGAKEFGLVIDAGMGHSQRNYHKDHKKALRGKQGFYDTGRSSKQNKAYSDSKGFNSYFDAE